MNIHSFYRPFLEYFRTRRMAEVCKTFQLSDATTILDVGGALYNWTLISVKPRLTILNLFSAPAGLPEGVSWVIGDGTRLPFPDRHFDICYSNSVIEHLCNLEAQKAMADEIRRVAKGYYVQTPNYRFPIEPHFISPFIHWLPVHLRQNAAQFYRVGVDNPARRGDAGAAGTRDTAADRGRDEKPLPRRPYNGRAFLGTSEVDHRDESRRVD